MIFWTLGLVKPLIALIFLALIFWLCIPLGLRSYDRWVGSRKTKNLADVLICGIVSLQFVIYLDVELVRFVVKFDQSLHDGISRIIFSLALVFAISYLIIPKILKLFERWKATKETKYFSLMTFLGVLSVFALSVIITIYTAIGLNI